MGFGDGFVRTISLSYTYTKMRYFLEGLTMGLAYVAPIGLQNLFVINAALTYSRRRALITAWIVVFFDITLALACFFGAGVVMARFQYLQMAVLLMGSVIVIFIGVGLLRSKETELERTEAECSVWKTIVSACVVTWLNPQGIIDGTMMLGAFRAALPAGQSSNFITGAALASLLWFTCLTLLIASFGHKFNGRVMRNINRVCGGVIVLYGVKLFLNFIQMIG